MNAEHPCDLGQRTPIQIIRGQDETVFAGKCGQGRVGAGFQSRIHRVCRLGLGRGKLRAAFELFVQAYEAFGAAVAIYKFLGQHGSQPALERSAAAERGQLRNTFRFGSGGAVQRAIQSVGEFASGGIITRDP